MRREPIKATRWKALFLSMGRPLDPIEVAKAVLSQLDGYGIEYGYDEDTDAESVVNAVTALMDIKIEGKLEASVSVPACVIEPDVDEWVKDFTPKGDTK